jgi:hypothetical protein
MNRSIQLILFSLAAGIAGYFLSTIFIGPTHNIGALAGEILIGVISFLISLIIGFIYLKKKK